MYGANTSAMKAITVRLDESTLESLDDEADEHGRTRSEHVREVIRARDEHDRIRSEYEAKLSEYEDRIEDLERENERLKREKRLILEQREENTELVNAVKEERSLAKRKAEAGLLTKTKWALFGMKDEESD